MKIGLLWLLFFLFSRFNCHMVTIRGRCVGAIVNFVGVVTFGGHWVAVLAGVIESPVVDQVIIRHRCVGGRHAWVEGRLHGFYRKHAGSARPYLLF